ncbi:adrenocorticotropic hormone receptor-like [Anneissia japonica]|uniref:adrenocorticotropic hormone receptor-like n=1 Tax=Anneissia japonica TaxID=1529436 RepID=UPI0014256475|nr:adrenocorticotropic hormone receptor-like [Anneissia japonica]XP_033112974.1 adrenocorticotropic hormone receptor-like [Anneissia japonica]
MELDKNYESTTIVYFPTTADGKTDVHDVPSVLYIVLGAFAALENALVLFLVLTSKKLRMERNVFLFSLSLADFAVGILSFLIFFNIFYESFVFVAVLDAMFLVSMFSISAVAIERYIVIVAAPFTYKNVMTLERCIIVCVLIWILTISVFIAVYTYVYNKYSQLAFCILSLILLIANYILYFRISISLRKNDRNVTEKLGNNAVGRSQKLIRSFSILLVVSTICWLPLCCFFIIAVVDKSVDENAFVLHILYCLFMSNSLVNPFIYWYRLPGIKEGIYDLACCWRPGVREKDRAQNTTSMTVSTSAV